MRISIREIITTLRETGNVVKTARLLGISRHTVYRWKKKARRVYGYKHFLSWQGLKLLNSTFQVEQPRHLLTKFLRFCNG